MIKYIENKSGDLKFVNELKNGDVVDTLYGVVVFDRILRGKKNWYGICVKTNRKIKIKITDDKIKLVGKCDIKDQLKTRSIRKYNDLKNGDFFSIKKRRDDTLELYRFIKETDSSVIAVNPTTNQRYTLHKGFPYVKVDELPY